MKKPKTAAASAVIVAETMAVTTTIVMPAWLLRSSAVEFPAPTGGRS
jgi:hypothetical protein